MATLIPGSRFRTLESDNHVLLAEEPAWHAFLDEVGSFLVGAPGGSTAGRT